MKTEATISEPMTVQFPIEQYIERCKALDSETKAVELAYEMVYPAKLDDIEDINGYPQCNRKTWMKIAQPQIELGERLNRKRAYDKQVMPGGSWMNWGFSTDETLKDGEVKLTLFKVKETA